MKKQKGFTLIELLVVIAIIAILSTVVMAGLNSARAKGRDAKRLSDIKQLQAALELFFDSCGGYPSNDMGDIKDDNIAHPLAGIGGGNKDVAGVSCAHTLGEYMKPLPVNPEPNGTTYQYCSAGMSTLLPTIGNPLTAANCVAAGSASYRIGFSLEGQSGSLPLGAHTATPSGII